MTEYLLLKWGTLKGWQFEHEATREAAQKYFDAGPIMMSVMTQHDTPEQKAALCELIDVIDGDITNDWSGEEMTKDQAKTYIMEYGK